MTLILNNIFQSQEEKTQKNLKSMKRIIKLQIELQKRETSLIYFKNYKIFREINFHLSLKTSFIKKSKFNYN